MATTNARIQFSTDSIDTWTTINPTLREGEPVLAKTNDGRYAMYAGNIGGSPFTESVLIWDETKAEGIVTSAQAAATEAGTYRDEVKASAKEAAANATKAETAATNAQAAITEAKAQATAAKTSANAAAKSAEESAESATAAETSKENAKASANAASTSQSSAALNEANAKTFAANAATSEANAKASEENAKASETAAATSAKESAESAELAKTRADSIKGDVEKAAASAKAAAESAEEAATQATNAADSATEAANEAKKLTKALKYKGTVEKYADLPTENEIGDVWNIQKANKTAGIKAGDNVAWSGEDWDNLGGTCDMSEYPTKTELAAGISMQGTGKIVWTNSAQVVSKITATEYTGNAATATKATQDGAGNVIAETYAPLASPTFSGTVTAETVNVTTALYIPGGKVWIE